MTESGRCFNVSVWSHKAYKNPFPVHDNSPLYVMDKLYNNGHPRAMRISELGKEQVKRGRRYGSPSALYSQSNVYLAMKSLEDAELVLGVEVGMGKSRGNEVWLTKQAVNYLRRMHAEQSLPEPLRKLLLGEKTR